MKEVRTGVTSLGTGANHANTIPGGQVKNLRRTAACDIVPTKKEAK